MYSNRICSVCINSPANVLKLDRGKGWHEAINFPHSVGFKIGTDLVCLSKNPLGKSVLVNSNPTVLDNGMVSFVCQQDQSLELTGTEVSLTFNDEMIGGKGGPVFSSLCKVCLS